MQALRADVSPGCHSRKCRAAPGSAGLPWMLLAEGCRTGSALSDAPEHAQGTLREQRGAVPARWHLPVSLGSAWALGTFTARRTPARGWAGAEKLLCCTLSITGTCPGRATPASAGALSILLLTHLPALCSLLTPQAQPPSCASCPCLEGKIHQCSWEKRHFLLPCPFR